MINLYRTFKNEINMIKEGSIIFLNFSNTYLNNDNLNISDTLNFIFLTNATLLKDKVTFPVTSIEGNDKWPLTIDMLEDVILITSLVLLSPC